MSSHHFPWSTLILGGVFLVGAVIFHLLERVAPIYPRLLRGPRRRAYMADITAAIVDGPVLSAISKLVACEIIIRVPQSYELITVWPWWLQFTVFFLVNDFMRYWLHRWYHTFPILWRLHRVHHTAVEMDTMTNYRIHVFEAVIKYGVVIFPFHVVGIDKWVLIIYSSIDILKGYWHHANLRTYIGKLNLYFNSAEQHWWHHSAEPGGRFANFGSVLSIWDRMFGTFYWPRGVWPETIGVHQMERFPETYWALFASAWQDDDEAIRRYHDPTVAGDFTGAPHDPPTSAPERAAVVSGAKAGDLAALGQ